MQRGSLTRIAALSLLLISLSLVEQGAQADQFSQDSSSAAAFLAGDQAELLEAEIIRYELIRDQGGWQPVPAEPRLLPGERHSNVRILRKRLRLTGDFTDQMGADPERFGATLVNALQNFQARHGLRVTGRLNAQTLNFLNVPVEARLAQLKQARDAWAAFKPRSVERRVWINIPEAEVALITDERIDARMRAVVGHPTRPTPEIKSWIRSVVVNPTWTVPQSIAGEDLLPRQIADGEYLSTKGIRVFDSWSEGAAEISPASINWESIDSERFPYRLRQDPGPYNSLGRFKFVFPNEHDVYLHDTPSRALLGLNVRSLSSGCIRLEDSTVLANWLETDARADIASYAADEKWRTRIVRVTRPMPIDIVYMSAWVAPDGILQFRRDIYRRASSVADTYAAREAGQ